RTSSALASAYGFAVTTTMVVDGLLGFAVVWKLWRWPFWRVLLVVAPLIAVDATFLSANLLKLFERAWAPLLFGVSMVLLSLTWRGGMDLLAQKTRRTEVPLGTLVASLEKHPPHVVPGTAVFLTSTPDFGADRLAAQSQAQQGAARAQRGADHHHHGHAEGERRGAGEDHQAVAPLQPRGAEVRLHGIAQRAEGACRRPQARLAVRHHVDVVLPVAPLAPAGRAFRHAALARPLVHPVGQVGERRHRLLPNPDRAGGRGRHPSHGVM